MALASLYRNPIPIVNTAPPKREFSPALRAPVRRAGHLTPLNEGFLGDIDNSPRVLYNTLVD
jgi:hypothetical protein